MMKNELSETIRSSRIVIQFIKSEMGKDAVDFRLVESLYLPLVRKLEPEKLQEFLEDFDQQEVRLFEFGYPNLYKKCSILKYLVSKRAPSNNTQIR